MGEFLVCSKIKGNPFAKGTETSQRLTLEPDTHTLDLQMSLKGEFNSYTDTATVEAVFYDAQNTELRRDTLWSATSLAAPTGQAILMTGASVPTGTVEVEVVLQSGRIHGWVQLGGNIDLTHYAGGNYETQRTTYRIAGETVAVQVVGDPKGNNGLYYLHSDHPSATLRTSLGSASSMSDTAGQRVDEITRYTPFGETRTSNGNEDITDMGFTGHKHNDSLGLVYMNARFYVPSIGRFASADTIVPDPTNPQAYNRYSYVYNNPILYYDPSGHMLQKPMVVGGADEKMVVAVSVAAWAAVNVLTPDTFNWERVSSWNRGQNINEMWDTHFSLEVSRQMQSSSEGERIIGQISSLLMGGKVAGSPTDPHDDKDYTQSPHRRIDPNTDLGKKLRDIFNKTEYGPEMHNCDVCAQEVKNAFTSAGQEAHIVRIRFPGARGIYVEQNGQTIHLSANDSHYFTVSDGMVYDSLTGVRGMTLEEYINRYFASLADDWMHSTQIMIVP